MNILKILLLSCLLIFLSGCYVKVDVIGEGSVPLSTGEQCTDSCTKRSVGEHKALTLSPPDSDGENLFLGYVARQNNYQGLHYEVSRRSMSLDYGLYLFIYIFGGAPPELRNDWAKVNAIFHPADDVAQVGGSRQSLCMINASQELKCWGQMSHRSLHDFGEVVGLVSSDVTYAWSNHFCLNTNQRLYCWNDHSDSEWLIPESLQHPVEAVMSDDTVCGLYGADDSTHVECFLEDGTITENIPPLSNPTNLRTDRLGGFCVDNVGQRICWGGDYYGQSVVPEQLTAVTDFAVGDYHTCAISQGALQCWGANSEGQLDVPDGLVAPTAVSAGEAHTCAQSTGKIVCWGNINLELTLLDAGSFQSTHLVSEGNHVCVVGALPQGQPYCYHVERGELATPDLFHVSHLAIQDLNRNSKFYAISEGALFEWSVYGLHLQSLPVQDATVLSAGDRQVCLQDVAGLRCWNSRDANGNYEFETELAPMTLGIQADSIALHDSRYSDPIGCATEMGRVHCWGNHSAGVTEPPEDLLGAEKVGIGIFHACALTSLEELACWGEDEL